MSYLRPFEILKNKKLAEYRDHPVLFQNVGHDEARKMSMAKQLPVGAVWCACLGTVFGPKPVNME